MSHYIKQNVTFLLKAQYRIAYDKNIESIKKHTIIYDIYKKRLLYTAFGEKQPFIILFSLQAIRI